MPEQDPFAGIEQPSLSYADKFKAYSENSTAKNAVALSIDVAKNALMAGEKPQEVGFLLKLGDPNIQNIWEQVGAAKAMDFVDKLVANAQKDVARQHQPELQQAQMDRKQELLAQLDKELEL